MISAAAIPAEVKPATRRGRLLTARTNGVAADSVDRFTDGWSVSLDGTVILDVDENGTLVTVEVLAGPTGFRSSDEVPEWPTSAREADVRLPRLREVEDDVAPRLLASRGKQRLLVLFGPSIEGAEPIKLSKSCIAYVGDGFLRGVLMRYDR